MGKGIDRERLRSLIKDSGKSARSVSLQADLGSTAVKDIISGKSKKPEYDTLVRIALALGVDVSHLVGGDEEAEVVPLRARPALRLASNQLPVRNSVQAGAWHEIDDQDQRTIETHPAPIDPRFPQAAQWLSRVRGDSMNALKKGDSLAGILDGDLVHIVDAIAIDYRATTGDVVEVERIRFDGRERELTLKQVEVTPGGILLWPRSTNPRWKDPLPYAPEKDGEDVEVRVRGKMLQVLRQF